MAAPLDLAGPPTIRARVTHLVAGFLKVNPNSLDSGAPLTRLGLDSLTSMELVAALEDEFSRKLPEWLLVDHPDIDAIVGALDEEGDARPVDPLEQMRADSVLPPDIRPPSAFTPGDSAGDVLLTGATGFLGAFLLRALMDETPAHVHCLVRGAPDAGRARVVRNLHRYRIWRPAFADRLSIVRGDLTQPRLGVTADDYEALTARIATIYHSGAAVNWALPYAGLRDANVLATRALLRLACEGRTKALHFVSSLSVCYAVGGPEEVVDENADALAHLDRLPLGYAQSKAVAESLVRQAADRGVPACIYRPAFITGDSTTGASNVDDLIAGLIKGCVQMGTAPDLDWTMDAAPVEHVARAIVRLPGPARPGLRSFHLTSRRPRHWRECILWMNLLGYSCRLVTYAGWLRQFEQDSQSPEHALHGLRTFFLRRVFGDATAPELYQDARRSTVNSARTRAAEDRIGLACPTLDAPLLDRYFGDYVAQGFLPAPPAEAWSTTIPGGAGDDEHRGRPRQAPIGDARRDAEVTVRGDAGATAGGVCPGSPQTGQTPPIYEDPRRIETLLRRHFADPALEVRDVRLVGSGSEHSIIGELTAWRHGQRVGLFHCRVDVTMGTEGRMLEVMAKVKPADTEVLEVGETLAGIVDAPLGAALHDFRDDIGIRGGHVRELAIYEDADVVARRYMPVCLGTWRDEGMGEWGLLLERLEHMALMDASDDPGRWSPRHVDSAIMGLAQLHASWMPRVPELERASWIGHVRSRARVAAMRPLWLALANHAAPAFAAWAGAPLIDLHRELIDSSDAWWRALDASPRTLIHHDFNPRNIALRHDGPGFRLCAYDWELATIGAPQRDLAELLCFVLTPEASREDVIGFTERHRRALSAAADRPLDRDVWLAGFRSALADLLTDRLAFYAMIHRVRPQVFLPRVLRTWTRLWTVTSSL